MTKEEWHAPLLLSLHHTSTAHEDVGQDRMRPSMALDLQSQPLSYAQKGGCSTAPAELTCTCVWQLGPTSQQPNDAYVPVVFFYVTDATNEDLHPALVPLVA